MKTLITGCAGFIGAAVANSLIDAGHEVVGIDNFNDYYNPDLKRKRVRRLLGRPGFELIEADIASADLVSKAFSLSHPNRVIHLAAQAGIRRALTDPYSYGQSNLIGFLNVIEASAKHGVEHFVFASTSSVYGSNATTPFSELHSATHPVSLYSATKIANEAIAHSYSATHGLACTGLRFFTVYGPWGRPDMAPIKFSKAILSGQPIQIYNNGNHSRDFTYIDDIVGGITKVLELPPAPNSFYDANNPNAAFSSSPWRLFNIGGESPIALMDFVAKLEIALNRKAAVEFVDRQVGDMERTSADCSELRKLTGWSATVGLDQGLAVMAKWCEENLDLL
jgi:UDP-glucuronate 4-epimerase